MILIGRDGDECITMEEVGGLSGRFNYEFACDLGKRIPRVYIHGGRIIGTRDHFRNNRKEWNTPVKIGNTIRKARKWSGSIW